MRELVRALIQLEEAPELALFDLGRREHELDTRELGLHGAGARVRRMRSRLPRRAFDWTARITGRGADRWLGGTDVFHHALLPPSRVSRARRTLGLSELPPARSAAEERLAEVLFAMDGVFVFSSHFRRELVKRFGLSEARIHQVPIGADHWRRELSALPVRDVPPTVVVLGAVEPGRRHAAIVRAVEILADRGLEARLLIAGRAGSAAPELRSIIARSRIASRVDWKASLPEPELASLLARSSALVHLSDEEGTPVTPLEACALGVPTLVSRLPAFEEALGGVARYVDNDAVVRAPESLADELAATIASAGDEGHLSDRVVLARSYTWDANARATLDVWKRLAAGTSAPPSH